MDLLTLLHIQLLYIPEDMEIYCTFSQSPLFLDLLPGKEKQFRVRVLLISTCCLLARASKQAGKSIMDFILRRCFSMSWCPVECGSNFRDNSTLLCLTVFPDFSPVEQQTKTQHQERVGILTLCVLSSHITGLTEQQRYLWFCPLNYVSSLLLKICMVVWEHWAGNGGLWILGPVYNR